MPTLINLLTDTDTIREFYGFVDNDWRIYNLMIIDTMKEEEEKSITEMTDDEVISFIESLRARRAEARMKKSVERAERETSKARKPRLLADEITGELGSMLDDLFKEAP